MNIFSISNFSYKPLNFKGKNTTNPIEDNKESKQNNSPDIRFDEFWYESCQINRATNMLEDSDLIKVDENDCVYPSENLDFSLDDEVFDEGKFAASMFLDSLKTASKLLGLPPKEITKTVPAFVKYQFKDFIVAQEEQITKISEQIDGYDFDDLCNDIDKADISEETKAKAKDFMSIGWAHLPEILNSQKQMVKKLKEMQPETQEILDVISSAINYQIFQAVQFGFDGDAKKVVDFLTSQTPIHVEPVIIDNNDGTLTYKYIDYSATVEVVRRADNLDYISATSLPHQGSNGSIALEFNNDGSIKNLLYTNNIDGSVVIVEQNKKDKAVKISQVFDGWISERNFICLEDGKMKQTSMKVRVKPQV